VASLSSFTAVFTFSRLRKILKATNPNHARINKTHRSAIVTYAKNRSLREEFYRAYMNRASSGATDNTPVIDKLLALRQEAARLLGFTDYAERAMATKVRTSPEGAALTGQIYLMTPDGKPV